MSAWKRESLAPNVKPIPDWVPKPPNGTDALKPGKDVVPVPATAKNGGWNGGTWMPAGIRYGVRNHGWGERAAAAWYEAHGYQSNAEYRVNPCTNSTETTYLLAASLTALAVLSFRYVQTRFKTFYGLAIGYAACNTAALIIKLSGMTNSVDIAYIFECLNMALFPFLCVQLSSMVFPPRDGLPGFSWNWITLFSSLTITAVLGAIDRVNFLASVLIPLVEHALLIGYPIFLIIRVENPKADNNTISSNNEEQVPSSGEEEQKPRSQAKPVNWRLFLWLGLALAQFWKFFFTSRQNDSSMSYCIGPLISPYLYDLVMLFVFCFETYPEQFEYMGSASQHKLRQQTTNESMELHYPTSSVDAGDHDQTPMLFHEDKERS